MMDIVFTYVNTQSKLWNDQRKNMKEKYFSESKNNIDGNMEHRFTDHDELRYAFRSIEKYIKFHHRIYIVVSDVEQIPPWINVLKVNIIYHSQIIPFEYLPTFNSQVIELYIHKIEGLSENFIYLNDDMIIGKDIDETDFIEDGKYKFYICKELSKTGIPNVQEIGYRSAWKNGNTYLNTMFRKEERYKLYHCPVIVNKNIYNILLEEMKDEVITTSQSRFRGINDLNIICSVYPYFMYYTNQGVLIQDANIVNVFENEKNLQTKYAQIIDSIFFCLNHFYEENPIFLNSLFPHKSQYEI